MFTLSKYPTIEEAINETYVLNNDIESAAFFCVNNSDNIRVRLDKELNYYLNYYLNRSGAGKIVLIYIGAGDYIGNMWGCDSH